MWNTLLDLFFPRLSLSGTEGEWITDDERVRMKLFPVRFQKELLRKKGILHLDCLIAAGRYDASPLLKKAIRTFKYGRIASLAPELGQKIVEALPGLLFMPQSESLPVLCPVPLHWTRKFHRGFNQAKLLADVVGKATNFPVEELLERVRPTGHQAWRKRAERLTAVTRAFRKKHRSPPPQTIILVDDIYTTGATMDACARTLKESGVRQVIGLVVAYD